MAATLASIVPSMPPPQNYAYPRDQSGQYQGQRLEKSSKESKGGGGTFGTMFGATWGEETFQIPHGEMDWSASAQLSEWKPDWVSEEPTPPEEPMEHECLKRGPSPRAVAPEPTCVD